jgi:aldehyde dehydrogenase (NAD+)
VWVNATNLFDAAAGFGGYRESGFGREGGREGMWEYLKPRRRRRSRSHARAPRPNGRRRASASSVEGALPAIDRTPKLYIGGKQARPDSGLQPRVLGHDGPRARRRRRGEPQGRAQRGRGGAQGGGWARQTGHARAQVLYYVAENLAARAAEFAARLDAMTGGGGAAEVEASVTRLFTYAAWADKYDGAVHNVPIRGVALAMHEAIGVIGVAAPEDRPLLGLISMVAPLVAMGNTVVAVPSERHPLAATDFYTVLDTSDVPGGVVNIVTGANDTLAATLAEHDDVDALWYFGEQAGAAGVERASTGNMKRTWAEWTPRDWMAADAEGREFLRAATQVKNVWVPYGE